MVTLTIRTILATSACYADIFTCIFKEIFLAIFGAEIVVRIVEFCFDCVRRLVNPHTTNDVLTAFCGSCWLVRAATVVLLAASDNGE
jgi:hypothetical protein